MYVRDPSSSTLISLHWLSVQFFPILYFSMEKNMESLLYEGHVFGCFWMFSFAFLQRRNVKPQCSVFLVYNVISPTIDLLCRIPGNFVASKEFKRSSQGWLNVHSVHVVLILYSWSFSMYMWTLVKLEFLLLMFDCMCLETYIGLASIIFLLLFYQFLVRVSFNNHTMYVIYLIPNIFTLQIRGALCFY